MKLLLKSFVWFWVAFVAAQMAFMIWYIGYGLFYAVAEYRSLRHTSIMTFLSDFSGHFVSNINLHFKDGIASSLFIAPSLFCGFTAFIIVIVLGTVWKKHPPNQSPQ